MKKISEMTPGEALTEQELAVFKRRLEQARKKAVESAAATKNVARIRRALGRRVTWHKEPSICK